MIDINLIRENPKLVKENLKKRFLQDRLKLVDKIKELDEKWRASKQKVDKLRAERNSVTKAIAEAKKKKDNKEASKLLKKAKAIPGRIDKEEARASDMKGWIDHYMTHVPNIIHESVPIGKDDTQNVVREVIGKPPKFKFKPKNHVDVAEALGLADFETSAETSGTGFYYLHGDLALLNQALIIYSRQFMLAAGYSYVEPPLMIREHILKSVYSKAEIEQMAYKIQDEDLYLIATSEHPLIGMFINKTLNHKKLPVKLTAYSMCFRKEIGSHGISEKGLFRTHQFNKQEMVVICHPSESYKSYEELMRLSKELYKNLGIPIRELESCSGDLGDLKAKGADLEFWRPHLQDYNEVGSVSNLEESQARLLNIKYFNEKGERLFVHTLNNTAIATSRAMVAILENFQQEDGSVEIPKVLRQYMGGKKYIGK